MRPSLVGTRQLLSEGPPLPTSSPLRSWGLAEPQMPSWSREVLLRDMHTLKSKSAVKTVPAFCLLFLLRFTELPVPIHEQILWV